MNPTTTGGLSRREMIGRVGGATLLLAPVLRARHAHAAATTKLLTFYYGNGPTAGIDRVFPARNGNGWDWSRGDLLTKALQPHEEYLSIVRGLWILSGARPKGSHGGAAVTWSTGSSELLSPDSDHHRSSDVSIDHWFAEQTKTSRLYLGVQVDGRWSTYRSSYVARNAPAQPEQNVARAYEAVFSGMLPDNLELEALRRDGNRKLYLLDAVTKDLQRARRIFGLGAEERQRLERYETALAEMEASVRQLAKRGESELSPAQAPMVDTGVDRTNVPGGTRAMLQIAVGSLALGLRRSVAFQLSNGFGEINYSFAGGPQSHHGAQHTGGEAQAQRATTWIHEQVAWLLTEMRAIESGPGANLLDESVVMVGTDCPHGADHNYSHEHPSLLFGKAAGRLRGNVEARPPDGKTWIDHSCWLATIGEALKVSDNEFARRKRASHMFRELLT